MNKMNKETDISKLQRLLKLRDLFQRVKQLSWNFSQTEKRYGPPEALTITEMEDMTKWYLAMGFDLEQMVEDWRLIKKDYDDNRSTK